MSNQEIIKSAALACGIFTEAEVAAYEANLQRLPLHTYAEWKYMGYQVRKGERAAMKCKIFMYRDEEPAENEKERTGRYYMKNAHFFKEDQVDRIAQ